MIVRIRSSRCLLVVFYAAPLAAQEVPPGTWKGTFRIDKGPETAVEYITHVDADSAAIFIRSATGDETQLLERRVEDGVYVFRWGALECHLSVKGNSREGPCRAADGTGGKLMLNVTTRSAKTAPDHRLEHSSDVVTSEEILGTRAQNLLDALRRLRPIWFATRPAAADELPYITVFVRGVPHGEIGVLGDMPVTGVSQIRYYSSSRAVIRFGKKYALGVIDVDGS